MWWRENEMLFEDHFHGRLGPGWTWIREHPDAWRISDRGLEVQVEPGNMWGPANDARNVLVRSVPDAADRSIEVAVTVENRPTAHFEQVNLVWFYDDSHMVKLGQEMVDGAVRIVMGREESDRTHTIAILPLKTSAVELRLIATGNRIHGSFRPAGSVDWTVAGECDLPAQGTPHVSLQCYQGPADEEHWATIKGFRISARTTTD